MSKVKVLGMEYGIEITRPWSSEMYEHNDKVMATMKEAIKVVLDRAYTDEPIADFVNQIWQHRPNAFIFTGWDPYGDSKTQTPIWIRPGSLMSGNKETFLKKDYIQIVGHTQVRYIDMGKATGGRYYFIDAIPERQYLVYENQEFSLGEL